MAQSQSIASPQTKTSVSAEETSQHPLGLSILLHIAPGFLVGLAYLLLLQVFRPMGLPNLFALNLAIPIVFVPVELGFLYFLGKKRNGKASLDGIVLYRPKISQKSYFWLVPALIAWSILVMGVLGGPVDSAVMKIFFGWVPGWYNLAQDLTQFSKPVLAITLGMMMIFANIIGPWIEELYFRGYLLPRLSRFGVWAPVLNAFLFSAYHFWSPWQFFTRGLAVLPLVYGVYKKKDITLGIWAHILLNTLSTIPLLPLLFK